MCFTNLLLLVFVCLIICGFGEKFWFIFCQQDARKGGTEGGESIKAEWCRSHSRSSWHALCSDAGKWVSVIEQRRISCTDLAISIDSGLKYWGGGGGGGGGGLFFLLFRSLPFTFRLDCYWPVLTRVATSKKVWCCHVGSLMNGVNPLWDLHHCGA